MGSMPARSILRGLNKPLSRPEEPISLHKIFEYVVEKLEKIKNDNNNDESCETIHGIKLTHEMLLNPALLYKNRTKSFAELNTAANRLARAIAVSIFSENDGDHVNSDGDLIVAVCLPPSDVLIVTLLACWKIGAAYMPIDPTFPQARIDHILRESEPALVIVEKKDRNIFPPKKLLDIESLQDLAGNLEGGNLTDKETVQGKVPLTAIVLYTSGSTGVPKGVRISHAIILNRLKWQWETFPYSDNERTCIFKTALTFVDSVSEIWGPLLNSRSLLIVPKEDAKDAELIMGLLEKFQIERMVLVPTLLQSILLYIESNKKKSEFYKPLPHLRLWVCSGEALPPSLVNQFYQNFDIQTHKLCNFYGSTEVMGDVSYYVISNLAEVNSAGKVAIGNPTYNSIIYLMDEKLNPVNLGETGEIYVSGLNLALGYVRNRDPDRFIHNNVIFDAAHQKLYRTGDYGRIYKNTLYYEGRKDSQIKVRGHRVDLSEIESALKKITDVTQSVVLAYKPGEVDQAIVAFVICGNGLHRSDIEQQLRNLVPPYMMPDIVVVDDIPLLVNGKVDRQYLLQTYQNRAVSAMTHDSIVDLSSVAGADMKKAKVVFETMAEVLGNGLRGRITADSNFFSLGGNSLNAVYFITKLRDAGYAISIKDFLNSQTLADVLEKVSHDKEVVTLVDAVTTKELAKNYQTELITEETKTDFIEVLAISFYEKADIESHLDPRVPYNDYVETIEACWKYILEDGLSFVVRDQKGQIVGAAMNKDAYTEIDPNVMPQNRLSIVLDFLDTLEHKVLEERLPKGKGKIIHNFMMGSRNNLTVQETIELFIYMEEEVMTLAKSFKYEGIFTSNTSPLTQQLGTNVNGYQTLLEYQVNQYVDSDGVRPFNKAPDDLNVIVCWKRIQ